jgi:hypothetical protein
MHHHPSLLLLVLCAVTLVFEIPFASSALIFVFHVRKHKKNTFHEIAHKSAPILRTTLKPPRQPKRYPQNLSIFREKYQLSTSYVKSLRPN